MNTGNSKPISLTKFLINLRTSLILKIQIKILHWLFYVFITHGNILDLLIRTINLKSLLQRGIMTLIFLMDHIMFQTFKIICNVLLKNMKR